MHGLAETLQKFWGPVLKGQLSQGDNMNTADIFALLLRLQLTPNQLLGIIHSNYAPQEYKDVAQDMLLILSVEENK